MRPLLKGVTMTKTNITLAMLLAQNMLKTRYILKLLKRYREVSNLNDTYAAEITYLVDIMNRNDIELDEFDLIALSHVSRKS
jgi:hypothetical protein